MAGTGNAAFVGIDAGTTGVTVALFDERGAELASADRDYPCLYPHPGWVEQEMDAVWDGICAASRAARAQARVGDDAIRSVGFSSQRGTFALLDAGERPLAPAIVWNDSRAKELEELFAERIGRERFRRITGMPLSASWAIVKIAWLGRHRPELLERARWICNGQEYFLHRLGAEGLETDPASLTLNGMLDIRRLDWSDEVLAVAGIDRDRLPPVGPPARLVGRISPEASEQTGLPAGTPICRGGGDQQCAAVGAGVIRQGMAEITVGTSAMMVAHLDHPDLLIGTAPYIGGHGIPGKWDLEGGAFSIGSCLNWWRDHFAHAEVAQAAEAGRSPFETIMDLAAAAPPGAKGVVFHPFFAGQVTPYYDATARGAFHGLGLHHDRACLTRAILEGCACEMRLMVEAFDRDLEGGLSDLRLTGGGTTSPLFTRIQADVIGRPVGLLENRECTVLGAAILGAFGAGHFATVAEAVDAMVRVKGTIAPDRALRARYDALYELFKGSYEQAAAAGLYRQLYDFQQAFF